MRGFGSVSRRGSLLVVIALAGFLAAGVLAGVGVATGTTTQTTPSTTTPPPKGDDGCTPGFWKNHPEDWQGFSTNQTLASVFNPAGLGGLGSTTLLDALKFKGGSTVTAAKRILLRQAVAALLNSAHSGVDFELTTAQVVAAVNAALASNNRSTILAAKNGLARLNERGCPL
jgi:hypothetical protein